jgi:hypothetical protein
MRIYFLWVPLLMLIIFSCSLLFENSRLNQIINNSQVKLVQGYNQDGINVLLEHVDESVPQENRPSWRFFAP